MLAHLEEIVLGTSFQTGRRTVTEADIAAFAGVSGDFNPLHVDEIFAREETPFGRRIAHGPLVLSMSFGLPSVRDRWKILALVECQRRFRSPVYPGDTVWAAYEVIAARASRSRPGVGFVTLAVEVRSDRGEIVQDGRDVLMLATRGHDAEGIADGANAVGSE
ncbi:MAG TPA: MaoC/PaaZ C-terminal domain-containing protein [Solirubrobacteraceae bacterium]|jgi:acyl dehydratase|nr:MaoC/PaaZ C-terminal domain-containing protein [Solirubrobacteraceae bacterium]